MKIRLCVFQSYSALEGLWAGTRQAKRQPGPEWRETAGRPLRKLLPELRSALSCLAWGDRGKNRENSIRKKVDRTGLPPCRDWGDGGDGGANPKQTVQGRGWVPRALQDRRRSPRQFHLRSRDQRRPSAMARESGPAGWVGVHPKTTGGRLYQGRTHRKMLIGDCPLCSILKLSLLSSSFQRPLGQVLLDQPCSQKKTGHLRGEANLPKPHSEGFHFKNESIQNKSMQ